MTVQIQLAQADQLAALTELLTQNQLSGDDLPTDLANFWLAFDGARLVGSAGIEVYGHIGLLRSVCVDAFHRNQNIARQLCEVAFREARHRPLRDLYLLTTTADRYFERLGFERIARTAVPGCIQQTAQFSSLCPSSAVVMKRTFFEL